ncbi:MAG TPA: hypothetical protein VK530_04105, partial [Candidatus Acidoferrum sp.]|nr:hypothetical protein [Candidatus Acidoferrum sp.]
MESTVVTLLFATSSLCFAAKVFSLSLATVSSPLETTRVPPFFILLRTWMAARSFASVFGVPCVSSRERSIRAWRFCRPLALANRV